MHKQLCAESESERHAEQWQAESESDKKSHSDERLFDSSAGWARACSLVPACPSPESECPLCPTANSSTDLSSIGPLVGNSGVQHP
jgi:hypothetical protein